MVYNSSYILHYPTHRSSIFDMFDQLLLLSEGRTVYLGPASGASEYFLSQGHPTPQYFNPADFFLDLLSPDNRSKEAELATGARILKLAGSWATLQEQRAVVKSDAVAAEQVCFFILCITYMKNSFFWHSLAVCAKTAEHFFVSGALEQYIMLNRTMIATTRVPF